MILGVGIDLVKITKTEKLLGKFGERFLRKVFTEREIQEGKSRAKPYEEFSAWFAAKEAVQKALGAGIFAGIRFVEIEVIAEPGKKPLLQLFGKAKQRAEEIGGGEIYLSISHESDYAMAIAVMESRR